ncbi:hypothetical protein I4U23_002397 [Adineta vaga]|nr:hypothetical protein I4U23_002397 [Adineta vaga]
MQVFSIHILFYQLITYSLIIHALISKQSDDNPSSSSSSSPLCPSNLFRCDTNRCLPYAFVCNGEYNCHDQTDEMNCSFTMMSNDLCPKNYSINCEQDILHSIRFVEHSIHNEYTRPIQICIQRSSVCDGIIDCRNAIDEQCTEKNPLIVCTEDEYHCKLTNRCIPKRWRCNGINDCLDSFASDELDCPMNRKCLSNEFPCRSIDQCVLSTAVCDGIQDCIDGSDESSSICLFPRFCTRDQFSCKSTKLCIPKSNLCDTISQCHDRSDEMFCTCPIEDYLTRKLFYRCGLTNKCLPKNVECHIKRQCHSAISHDDEDDDDDDDEMRCSFINQTCSMNKPCLDKNQYCDIHRYQRCICKEGYRMNETTGLCEDINECRERVICDHYCMNTLGSYHCSCQENYQLKSDKHTCTHRIDLIPSGYVYSLLNDGIYKFNLNDENEIVSNNQTLVTLADHAYLLDYDPIEKYLYFAECKTRIYRIYLNQSILQKELIIDGRDYTSIQSLAIDWFHKNIYFVNTRLQTIDVCRLNGSFCQTLLHQTLSDYLPQRIVLYPEKGLLFYTASVKSRALHVIRLGMDGTNLKLLFTIKITNDVNYLQSLLTIDRINHHLYFYNGLDKIFIINIHGDILHVQHEALDRFHSFKIFADKIYKAFDGVNRTNRSEFRINPKYALGTKLLEPGFVLQSDRYVHSSYNKSSSFGSRISMLNSLRNLYHFSYSLHMTDFIIVDIHETKESEIRCNQCEQLCFPNVRNQTEITCSCAQYYHLKIDGRSCTPGCPEYFFNCPRSKKCIPFYQRCNGIVDCLFNEDETNCQNCNTTSSFHCSNSSKCITTNDLCNNITDCLHGEDEHDTICKHFCEWPSLNTCTKKYPNLCSNNEFYCDGKCVSIIHRCDDKPYCYDGTDEPFDCSNVTCPYEYFKCPLSGKCIPYEKICDNVGDCPLIDTINGISADERAETCSLILNHLTNLTTTTINPSQIYMTCESADLFRCKTSNFCINRTYVCDGDLDCSDSSDEENCENFNTNGLISLSLHKDYTCMNGYRCAQQRHELDDYNSLCIPLAELCDGISQCPLGDDEHQWRCRNCTDCDSKSSFCKLINRLPTCECKNGYTKMANGSCIPHDILCTWSYDTCSHRNFSRTKTNPNFYSTKNSSIKCQCDRGYDIKKNDQGTTSCIVQTNQQFDAMLNPRSSFYLYQHNSIIAPVNPSHHLIDMVFIPYDRTTWCLLYTEQRNGQAFIWQQKLNRQLNSTNASANNAIQIWSSSLFYFTSLDVDWIHRFVYALYEDPSSSTNGIEILYATTNDYTHLIFVNRMTFSNTKTISSINVQPLQGYLYISAYYDAQHSFVYRSLLDGSNLEIFLTLPYPVLSMTIDYRHPRLYTILSNGDIDSYTTDSNQPWKTNIYSVKNYRPYSIDLHDDTLVVMISNTTDSTYDEIWLNKFGGMVLEKHRKLKSPIIVRYIHEFKYPTVDTSNMVYRICSESSCLSNRICITTPSYQPLCITPGQMNRCGSSCYSRGICSNGHCVCSNRTYVGDDCEMCRLTDTINVGCFHMGNDTQPPCMCYLSQSKTRQTPYLCSTFKNEREEIEVPCDRMITSITLETCSRSLFDEPICGNTTHSLIYHRQTQTCVCRETLKKKPNCLNNGLLIIDDDKNSSSCSCLSPFFGNQCQWSPCSNHCQNNGTCILNGTIPFCNCLNGFTGTHCQNNTCQSIVCEHHGVCVVRNNRPLCHCPSGFTGYYCHIRRQSLWRSWILITIVGSTLFLIGYILLRYNSKFLRLKHLFSYRHLQEQIGLQVSSTNTIYSHVPTCDTNIQDHPIDNVLCDDNQKFDLEMTNTQVNHSSDDYQEDPFCIDEKQPIFSKD